MTPEDEQRITQTILSQLGRQFNMMMGVNERPVYGDDGDGNIYVRVKIDSGATKGIRYITITLTADDLYTVEFAKIYRREWKVISAHAGIYNDMLIDLIEDETGMYTTLTGRRAA